MRNLKTYKLFLENYSEVKNKIDEILDKISSHGMESQREGGEASEKAYSKLALLFSLFGS